MPQAEVIQGNEPVGTFGQAIIDAEKGRQFEARASYTTTNTLTAELPEEHRKRFSKGCVFKVVGNQIRLTPIVGKVRGRKSRPRKALDETGRFYLATKHHDINFPEHFGMTTCRAEIQGNSIVLTLPAKLNRTMRGPRKVVPLRTSFKSKSSAPTIDSLREAVSAINKYKRGPDGDKLELQLKDDGTLKILVTEYIE